MTLEVEIYNSSARLERALTTQAALEVEKHAKDKVMDFMQAALDNADDLRKEGVDMKLFNQFLKVMVEKAENCSYS